MKKRQVIILICFIVLESALWWAYSNFEGNTQSVLLGLLTSLNASLLFYILSEFVLSDSEGRKKELDSQFATLHTELQDLSNVMTNANEIVENGLVSVRPKNFYDGRHGFWCNVLEEAQEGLDLAGYTLSSWFEEEYKEDFTKAIHRLVEAKKKVRIIMLNPKGSTIKTIDKQIEGSCREKADRIKEEFRKINEALPRDKRRFLQIHYATSSVIPYMYIRNDKHTIISPYMCVGSSKKSFLTVFKNDSQYASTFRNDFGLMHHKMEDWGGNSSIQDVEERATTNQYSGHGWQFEETIKYIYTIDNKKLEAGYFLHYADESKRRVVKHAIEMPSSFGCPMKCMFCASSNIRNVAMIPTSSMLDIFRHIYSKHNLAKEKLVVLTLTGTGDFYFTKDNVMPFLDLVRDEYRNVEITVSSVYWTEETLRLLNEIDNLRKVQITYISDDKNKVASVIPHLRNMDYSAAQVVQVISASPLSCFRINYLMLDGVNSGEEDFARFAKLFEPVKDKILVRVSKLNETKASQRNSLAPAPIDKLETFVLFLEEQGFEAYVFRSHENDNMNCGQLLTEGQPC